MKSVLYELGQDARNPSVEDWPAAPLTLPDCEEIEDLSPPQSFGSGDNLYLAGSPACQVYLIRRGVVKLKCYGHDRREMIVGIRSTGWLLGAESAILGGSHTSTAVALSNGEVSVFSSSEFLRAIQTPGPLTRHLQVSLSQGAPSVTT
jgi:CRP-like cAMP-binding protein